MAEKSAPAGSELGERPWLHLIPLVMLGSSNKRAVHALVLANPFFADSDALVVELSRAWQAMTPEQREAKALKYLMLFEWWTSAYPSDLKNLEVERRTELAKLMRTDVMSTFEKKATLKDLPMMSRAKQQIAKLEHASGVKPMSNQNRPPPPAKPVKNILDAKPMLLAASLTKYHQELFRALSRRQLFETHFDPSTPPGPLARLKTAGAELHAWVNTLMETGKRVKDKAKILKFFMKLCDKLVSLGNLFGAIRIVDGFSARNASESYDDLFAELPKDLFKVYERISENSTLLKHRAALSKLKRPAFPDVDIYVDYIRFVLSAGKVAKSAPTVKWSAVLNASFVADEMFRCLKGKPLDLDGSPDLNEYVRKLRDECSPVALSQATRASDEAQAQRATGADMLLALNEYNQELQADSASNTSTHYSWESTSYSSQK